MYVCMCDDRNQIIYLNSPLCFKIDFFFFFFTFVRSTSSRSSMCLENCLMQGQEVWYPEVEFHFPDLTSLIVSFRELVAFGCTFTVGTPGNRVTTNLVKPGTLLLSCFPNRIARSFQEFLIHRSLDCYYHRE